MKYTITAQLYTAPLNNRFHKCEHSDAKYQMEIYKTRETRNNICIIQPFNNGQFTHNIDSTIHFVPGHVIDNIILPANIDCHTKQR